MTHASLRFLSAGAAALCFLATAMAAQADGVKLNASLKPASATSKAAGTLTGTYDEATKKLAYTVEYSGLSGPAVAAHFHGPAAPGKDAGVAVPVQGALTSPIKTSATLTDAQAADLLAGKYYFNIHTQANPMGEIRGQVETE